MSAELDPLEAQEEPSAELTPDEPVSATAVEEPQVPEERIEPIELDFDLTTVENPSFAALEAGRAEVFETPHKLRTFRARVEKLGTSGEEGRRRGLGLWMVGDFEAAVDALAPFEKDDVVASFTRANALMSLGRHADAEPIFARLSSEYPEEPRPRCGRLEAALEVALAAAGDNGDDSEAAAVAALEAELEKAPESFQASAEYHYLRGRAAELKRDWEQALDCYVAAREVNPHLRSNLFRAGHLAERCGLDEEALEFYTALADLRPADKACLLNLGILYEDMGEDKLAAGCYNAVVEHDPTDERARLYLADAVAAIDMYYDEDLERKEDRLNQILRIPITDFELSVRARNCLNKMQILVLGDLVCRTEQELLSYKNFGETSLNEIKEILRSKGLRLGMPREEAVASIEARGSGQAYTGENSDVMNRPVHELQCSIRVRRTVETLGCLTLGDVTKHSADELLGMPNFGVTSLQELRSKLGEHGLKLRGD